MAATSVELGFQGQLVSVFNLEQMVQAENLEQLSSPARRRVTTVRKTMYGR